MREDPGVEGDAQRIGQLVWMLFLKFVDNREIVKAENSERYESPLPRAFRWQSWAAPTGRAIRRTYFCIC